MDAASRQFLAGTGRTNDEDAAIGRCDLFDRLTQLVDGGGVPDQRRRQQRPLPELLDLAFESRSLQGAMGDQDKPVSLEWLLDEVIGTALDGRHRSFDISVAGDHYDR